VLRLYVMQFTEVIHNGGTLGGAEVVTHLSVSAIVNLTPRRLANHVSNADVANGRRITLETLGSRICHA